MTKPGWLLTLERDGVVVLPNVVPEADCKEFADEAIKWLGKFPHGFKQDDRSTWTAEHLPYSVTGGLYNRYSVNHESFVWKIRTQPGIIKAFEEMWGTDDLIVSFDGMNATLPINKETGRTDIEPTKPWPHIDQNCRDVDRLELYQGIANCTPSGPNDGGLCVLKGSHLLHEQRFAEQGGWRAEQDLGVKENGYNMNDQDMEWYMAHGCEKLKVLANVGDLILWDSRIIHWNASPTGATARCVCYVCYCPRSMCAPEELALKYEIFQARKGTTHWPNKNRVPAERPGYHNALPRRPDDTIDPANRTRPWVEPEETATVLRLVGVR